MAAQLLANWFHQAQRHIGIGSGVIRCQAYGYLRHANHLAARADQLRYRRHHMTQALEDLVLQAQPAPTRLGQIGPHHRIKGQSAYSNTLA